MSLVVDLSVYIQSRLLLEGARSGCYVRISISGVPVEFTRNFNPAIPVIVGGVAVSESKMGIVTVGYI